MKIMSVNSGSSSVKFQLFEMPSEKVIASGQVEKIGYDDATFTIKHNDEKKSTTMPIKTHEQGVQLIIEGLIKEKVLESMDEIEGVGHRVVHGGEKFFESAIVTDEVLQEIKDLSDLAPLHNPANAMSIEAFMSVLPNVVHVAVFDTAFHQTMKEDVYLYAVPYEWYTEHAVRKYGFHGTSHQYVSLMANKLLNKEDPKVIVCHIGNGASITAVRDGKVVDTSMGLTPLDGIPMGTRSGSLDPAILTYIERKLNLTSEQVNEQLNKQSGYLGISEYSSDARDIECKIKEGDEKAIRAFDIQAKRIADYIGSYFIAMEGLDAIVFTAGIGENSWYLRKIVTDRLKALGVVIDQEKNEINDTIISTEDSKVQIMVIKTDEELMLAREVLAYK